MRRRPASATGGRLLSGIASKSWNAKTSHFVRRKRFSRKRLAILRPLSSRQAATAAQRDGARPPVSQMIAFIKDHRGEHGSEPICRVLQIAPSTFYEHIAIGRDPDPASDRAKRDAHLRKEMEEIWTQNRSVHDARKLWHAMKIDIARCAVERLMRQRGIQGVRRGKKIKTTHGQPADQCPLDKVKRQFRAS